MRILGLTLTLLILAGVALALIKTQRPDMFYSLMISFHITESQENGADEQDRLARIRLLPISQEKKQFLIQRTVFMGATTQMVELALGQPKQRYRSPDPSQTSHIVWVYHFEGDNRPTVLEFDGNTLTSAYRTSAHGQFGDAQPAAASATQPAQ